MANINLLPQDVVRVHEAKRITQILKILSILLGTLSLGLGLLTALFFFYQEKGLTTLTDKYNSDKSKVLALEATENSLILVRDRLTKINEVNSKYPYNKSLKAVNDIFKSLPSGIALISVDGGAEGQTVTFSAQDLSAVDKMLQVFLSSLTFPEVTIKNINYFPLVGYKLVVNISNI